MKGCSHTAPEGEDFALRVMNYLPAAPLTAGKGIRPGLRAVRHPRRIPVLSLRPHRQGEVRPSPDVTDKGLLHQFLSCGRAGTHRRLFQVHVRKASSRRSPPAAPCSYVEIPNLRHNLEALEDVVRFIYDNIQYAGVQHQIGLLPGVRLTARSSSMRITVGVPGLRQQGPLQNERHPPHLRLSE